MDRKNYYKKLAELINPPTDRNDFLNKRFGAPMKKMTYRDTCIDYVKKTMPCVGYRDYVVKELKKLEQIERIVNAPMGGKHERYNKIVQVLEQE